MTNNEEMTYTEQCAVDTAIEASNSIKMISPKGKEVFVPGYKMGERLAAGYRIVK
jgi:hypothetical protein